MTGAPESGWKIDAAVENALLRGALFLTARALKDYQDSPAFEIDDGVEKLEVVILPSLREKADDALARADKLLRDDGRGCGRGSP